MIRKLSLLLALCLSGCLLMDIPQPFRHQGLGSDLTRPPSDQDPEIEAAPIHRPNVRLPDFSGLPGDGNQSLRRAVKSLLERQGILVVTMDGDAVINPRFQVDADRTLRITWIINGPDGKEWGQASQQGPLPPTADGAWGRLATDIAQGSGEGIVKILQTAFAKAGGD